METLERTRTIAQRLKRPVVYNGKELWEVYHGWGSAATVNRLLDYATSRGMFKFDKSKASRMGPFVAMWRYAYENPEEAYPVWKKWVEDFHSQLAETPIDTSFHAFKIEIRDTIKNNRIRRPSKLKAWCVKWGVEY